MNAAPDCQQCHGTGRQSGGPFGDQIACLYCNGTGKSGLFTGDWVKWVRWAVWAMVGLGLVGVIPALLK